MILRTIHVGILGRGEAFLETIARDQKYRPVAIVDANTTAAKVAQYKVGSIRRDLLPIFSGLTGALSQIEADVLIIHAPTRAHVELCRMAFTLNQHVLLDRPMAPSLQDAMQLSAEAESTWSKFMIVQPSRYTPAEQTISRILENPGHPHHPGEVKLVDVIVHRHRAPSDGEYPFYMIWENAIDYADSLLAWLGKAKRATARSFAAPWTRHIQEANLWATLEYDRGAQVNLYLSDDAFAGLSRIVLQGERGWLVLTDGVEVSFYPCPTEITPVGERQIVDLIDCPAPEEQMAGEFFRYVVGDVEPPTSSRRNLRALTTCELLARAIKNKRPVERAELES